jgi:hypothetical protein
MSKVHKLDITNATFWLATQPLSIPCYFHPTIVYYKCYILIGYSAVVYSVIDILATAENSRFAEVSEEFSW